MAADVASAAIPIPWQMGEIQGEIGRDEARYGDSGIEQVRLDADDRVPQAAEATQTALVIAALREAGSA